MYRREFMQLLAAGAAVGGAPGAAAKARGGTAPMGLLADKFVTVYESPDPQRFFAYSPGLACSPSGRLVATMDQGGPGTDALVRESDGRRWRGRIYTSDNRGRTWKHRADTPLEHARPFAAGGALYVLGQDDLPGQTRESGRAAGAIGIVRSEDDGNTWSEPVWLAAGDRWHQAPCNVWYVRGRVYLVMECVTDRQWDYWPVAVIAPVVMSAPVDADLTREENWTFSNRYTFNDALEEFGAPNLLGVPFFDTGDTAANDPDVERPMAPIGWLEANIIQFSDPDHVWHDPSGRTFHLWMRAHTGTTNLACIAKAVEAEDGSITVSLEQAPSGQPVLYMPCPGGQMKFHLLYDAVTRLFWLLSSQATDSMTRPDRLPKDRFNLPTNERHRLVLHFSRNCVDWVFAGRIADSGAYGQGRHYASMVIDGDDLHVLSRSGDHRARSAHDGNLITFHTVRDFRRLVY